MISRGGRTGRLGSLKALMWGLLALVGSHGAVEGQLSIEDLVITGGASAEGYQGNLPAVGVPVQDSTEFATAAIGEAAVRADLSFRRQASGTFRFTFDGGLRQFSARGFELKDYSPAGVGGDARRDIRQVARESRGVDGGGRGAGQAD